MNAIEKTVLDRFKELLLRRARLHKLILFGSRARGDADPYSDLDVLVVLEGPSDQETRGYVSDSAWEAGFEHGIVVVPIVFSRDEWESGPESHSLLAQAVEADGVSL
jgi:predicted nucleotidyltransferase